MRIKRTPIDRSWPAWFYGPDDQAAVFPSQDLVPEGWTRRKGDVEPEYIARPTVILDRGELVEQLVAMNVDINPTWGNAHMKRIIDGEVV